MRSAFTDAQRQTTWPVTRDLWRITWQGRREWAGQEASTCWYESNKVVDKWRWLFVGRCRFQGLLRFAGSIQMRRVWRERETCWVLLALTSICSRTRRVLLFLLLFFSSHAILPLNACGTDCHFTSLQHHPCRLPEEEADAVLVQPQFSVLFIFSGLVLGFWLNAFIVN